MVTNKSVTELDTKYKSNVVVFFNAMWFNHFLHNAVILLFNISVVTNSL